MFSPFLLRHALLVLAAGGNLAASLWLAWQPADGIARRAFTLSYAAVSLAVFLFASALVARLEPSESWRAAHKWNQLRPGLTKPQVAELLGPPGEIAEEFYFYDLHPNHGLEGSVEFEGGLLKTVFPADATVWGSEAMWKLFDDHRTFCGMAAGLAFIPILVIASLLPFGMSRGWLSLPLYYPLFALLCALAYESVQKPGWRFDLFLMVPAYGVIAVAWIVRVFLLIRR